MNMRQRAMEINRMWVSKEIKIKLLNDFILDCNNELEAQDQNMRPELHKDLGESVRLAKNYLRKLTHH